jgi:hypothetical protein
MSEIWDKRTHSGHRRNDDGQLQTSRSLLGCLDSPSEECVRPLGSSRTEIVKGGLLPPIAVYGVENCGIERFSQGAITGHSERVFLRRKCSVDQFYRGRKALLDAPGKQRFVINESINFVRAECFEAVLQGCELPVAYLQMSKRVL